MSGETTWLSKSEVNSLFYNAVAGDIAFSTEGEHGFHPNALARLIARRAATLGKREIRILEIGANNCRFARSLIADLRLMAHDGSAELVRVDYLAVEYARATLESAVDLEEGYGVFDQIRRLPWPDGNGGPPAKPTIVAYASVEDRCNVHVGLVHSEANQFVRANTQTFDFAILNELLDDMPYRAFYADGDGQQFEIVPTSYKNGEGWTVRVDAEPAPDGLAQPPETVTGRSPESVELVAGVADLLTPGGMMFVHDYGTVEDAASLDMYEPEVPSPAWVKMEFPEGQFPRSYFRVFGNDTWQVPQVTNDVNFAELREALEPSGTVIELCHGNAIINRGGALERGQGVFLSEFIELEHDADLDALLADLNARQEELRENFVRDYMGGRRSMFLDMVFIKD